MDGFARHREAVLGICSFVTGNVLRCCGDTVEDERLTNNNNRSGCPANRLRRSKRLRTKSSGVCPCERIGRLFEAFDNPRQNRRSLTNGYLNKKCQDLAIGRDVPPCWLNWCCPRRGQCPYPPPQVGRSFSTPKQIFLSDPQFFARESKRTTMVRWRERPRASAAHTKTRPPVPSSLANMVVPLKSAQRPVELSHPFFLVLAKNQVTDRHRRPLVQNPSRQTWHGFPLWPMKGPRGAGGVLRKRPFRPWACARFRARGLEWQLESAQRP